MQATDRVAGGCALPLTLPTQSQTEDSHDDPNLEPQVDRRTAPLAAADGSISARLQPIVLSAVVLGSSIAYGQNSSLFYQDVPSDDTASLRVSNCSWVYQKSRAAAASEAARSDQDRRAREKRLG